MLSKLLNGTPSQREVFQGNPQAEAQQDIVGRYPL